MSGGQHDPTKPHAVPHHDAPPPPPPSFYGTFYATAPPLSTPQLQQSLPPAVLPVLAPHHVVQVGYQSYVHPYVAEGVPVKPLREPRLPCCGLGIGWALFVAGFFLAAVPWYVGAFILLFVVVDHREKAGLVACAVAAVLAAIAAVLGVPKNSF